MTVIVCIDDRGGMLFNNRRQSRDRVLTEDIVKLAESENARLLAAPFSEKLLSEFTSSAIFAENFLEAAEKGDICFNESKCLAPIEDKISRLIIYRWNRTYPYDFGLDITPTAPKWSLASTEELVGYSHEKITKETYIK